MPDVRPLRRALVLSGASAAHHHVSHNRSMSADTAPLSSSSLASGLPYSDTGGLRVGRTNYTWPFATIVVSNGEVRVSLRFPSRTADFSAAPAAIAVRTHRGFFSRGLSLTAASWPPLVFWSFKAGRLTAALRAAGCEFP